MKDERFKSDREDYMGVKGAYEAGVRDREGRRGGGRAADEKSARGPWWGRGGHLEGRELYDSILAVSQMQPQIKCASVYRCNRVRVSRGWTS